MNKTEFITEITKKTELSKKDVEAIYTAFTNTITEALKEGDKVTLTGFGTFGVSHRNARVCKNPQTGEAINVDAKEVPNFKAGAKLKEIVANA